MFSVMFEVQPDRQRWDAYLANAKMLHPELGQAAGLVDNIRFRSLTRDGWILSLSGWRDEASVVAWHNRVRDDEAGENGRNRLLADYRLRVGEVTSDTRAPDGRKMAQDQPNHTGVGECTYVTLIDAKQTPQWVAANNPQEMALYLGFDLNSYGDCISWDIFDSLSSTGEIILLVTWKDARSAEDHAATQIVPGDARVRVVRVIRDHAIFFDCTAPEDHPDAAGRATTRA